MNSGHTSSSSVSGHDAGKAPGGMIVGGGEMGDRVRAHDWASTELGPIAGWTQELVAMVNLALSSPLPSRVLWGPEFLMIYNDGYREIAAERHPAALGQPTRLVWPEAWPVVGPQLEGAYQAGRATFYEEIPVPMETGGEVEDHFLNYFYIPVYEAGRVAGLFGHVQDVTEEVLAKRRLRESEIRASRILQSIGDAVIVTDAATRIRRMNPVAEKLTGWTQEEAEGLPLEEVFRIVNERTREKVESPAAKVRRLGTVVGLANHTVLQGKDGTETHIDDSGAPVRDDEGNLSGIVLVFREINDRRAAERERDALAQRLHQALEATTDSVLSIGRDWRVTYVNRPAQKAVGPIETLGRNFWECFPAAVYEGSPFVEHYYRAMDEGVSAEFEAFYPEMLNIWVKVNVRPTPDGIVLFFRDVTEEKRTEARMQEMMQALQGSEEELRWRVKLSVQMPWTADTQGGILDTTEQWLALTGLTHEESLGNGWMLACHPEDVPEMVRQVRSSLEREEPLDMEHRLRMASGEYRWMRSRAFPRRDAAGRVVKWYGTTEDIEDRKRAERALIQSEMLAIVGRQASSIAHEINNPLESVTNLLYLARDMEQMETVREYLSLAEQELRRVSIITAQTLSFHKQAAHPKLVRCEELIEGVLSIYQGRVLNSRVRVEKRKRTERGMMCFDGEIRQVLANLVGNAIDAMHPTGGRLLLRSREATDWKTGRKGLAITVADTGHGIGEQTRKKLFDPFFTTKEIGGTGLGLWISREIVRKHHGTLTLRSRRGESGSGTVFVLFLPFEAAVR